MAAKKKFHIFDREAEDAFRLYCGTPWDRVGAHYLNSWDAGVFPKSEVCAKCLKKHRVWRAKVMKARKTRVAQIKAARKAK